MHTDLYFIFNWWLVLFGVGILNFPLTSLLFSRFIDKGWAFSKILSLILITFIVWFLGSLKIVSFDNLSLFLAFFLLLILNLWLLKFKINLKTFTQQNLLLFVFEESLFFICLWFWAYIRSFQPDIEGLEKFMDFGFVNSILKTNFFPPSDMWFAGNTINYYYFGHLITAVLTKLSGIDSFITYNLMIATIFALVFTTAFSLGGNLTRRFFLGGFLTAVLLNFSGNLQTLYHWLTFGNFDAYWYPDATRFIVEKFGAADNTIHEFPLYSYVVADLHGHLLDLPIVILFLALVYSKFILTPKTENRFLFLFVFALIMAVMYMTNTWDYMIYFLVLGAVSLLLKIEAHSLNEKTILNTIVHLIPIILLSILFFLPFQLNFKNIASGVALAQYHTPPWMLAVLWGAPFFFSLIYLFTKNKNHYITGLLLVSWFLIIVPEFIYVKDIYIQSYQRANTMFKFTYQSFVMFSLIGSYVLLVVLPKIRPKILLFFLYIVALITCLFLFIYPYFAIKSYYGLVNYRGLSGSSYLQTNLPSDWAVILWLNSQPDRPVIVEAVGESYTQFARISANTGLPTILGWRVHEWLWRGSFDEPGQRTEEVRQIYESVSLEDTQKLLSQYQVKYIIVGAMERKAYPNLQIEKFSKLGKEVFSSQGTTIYEIN